MNVVKWAPKASLHPNHSHNNSSNSIHKFPKLKIHILVGQINGGIESNTNQQIYYCTNINCISIVTVLL